MRSRPDARTLGAAAQAWLALLGAAMLACSADANVPMQEAGGESHTIEAVGVDASAPEEAQDAIEPPEGGGEAGTEADAWSQDATGADGTDQGVGEEPAEVEHDAPIPEGDAGAPEPQPEGLAEPAVEAGEAEAGQAEDLDALETADAGQDLPAEAGTPWPVPELSPDPPPPCAEALSNAYYFQFLDNLCDEKVWPSVQDRDRTCPVVDDSPFATLPDGSTLEYKPSSAGIQVDAGALDGIVPQGLSVAVILVKRVAGVPHYRYLSNGSHDAALQPWSSTKFLAVANAASVLRIQSSYAVGLTANVGSTPLGDLVSSIHTYDDDPYSSNALAAWFHDIGGRPRANDLIHQLWLDRPAGESFGGNYGEAPPASLGYTFTEPGGAGVTIEPDTTSGIPNHLSMLTLAEALKRLVLHREEPSQRLPGLQWKDLGVLFFGAEGSQKYGDWGGMSADTAVYLQSGHDMGYIEARSHGQWVILSKLGLGSQGQFVDVGYACWPVLDDAGAPVPGRGREFLIAAHLATGGSTWRERDRLLATAFRAIILRIVDGRL
jgi:hypothetical protein